MFFHSTRQEVLMAHGLRRVSYATCDPGCKQFSFLARQPGGHINKQYCHLFLTKTAEQVGTVSVLLSFSHRCFIYAYLSLRCFRFERQWGTIKLYIVLDKRVTVRSSASVEINVLVYVPAVT